MLYTWSRFSIGTAHARCCRGITAADTSMAKRGPKYPMAASFRHQAVCWVCISNQRVESYPASQSPYILPPNCVKPVTLGLFLFITRPCACGWIILAVSALNHGDFILCCIICDLAPRNVVGAVSQRSIGESKHCRCRGVNIRDFCTIAGKYMSRRLLTNLFSFQLRVPNICWSSQRWTYFQSIPVR